MRDRAPRAQKQSDREHVSRSVLFIRVVYTGKRSCEVTIAFMSYRRYYRRPYYRRHSRYNRGNESPGLKLILIVFGACIFFLYSAFNGLATALSALWGWAVFIGVIALVIIFIKKLFAPENKLPESDTTKTDHLSDARINSEKHGCKCYMEGLDVGEQEVASLLSRELSYKDYFIFNNLILPSENNGSTQIDHIVISRFGIFVIESKDYNGWIFGSKDDPMWVQSLPGGKNKFSFQNPTHQNYAHIMALKVLMPFATDKFYSVVVFSDKSEFKTPSIENVVHLDQLIGCIKQHSEERLSETDVQLAIGKLSYACQTVDITASQHIANLQMCRPN